MATGDFKWFAQGLHDLGNKLHDLDSDDWRMGVVTTGNVPTVNETGPHWGGTGTTNFATNQVATGTAYAAPIVLVTEAWTLTSTGAAMDFGDITIAQDAGGGFANGRFPLDADEAARRVLHPLIAAATGSPPQWGVLYKNYRPSPW